MNVRCDDWALAKYLQRLCVYPGRAIASLEWQGSGAMPLREKNPSARKIFIPVQPAEPWLHSPSTCVLWLWFHDHAICSIKSNRMLGLMRSLRCVFNPACFSLTRLPASRCHATFIVCSVSAAFEARFGLCKCGETSVLRA